MAGLFAAALALGAYGYAEATRTPRVVTYAIASPRWTAPPVRIALLSDTHVAGPDMPPERLARIVAQVNALKPDLVLLAGDYRSDRHAATRHYAPEATVAAFAALRARLGVFAVTGNHEYLGGVAEPTVGALVRGGATVLRNSARRTAGGFWVVGIEDGQSDWDDPAGALARVPRDAPAILLVHNPDQFARLPWAPALTVAGHTHGGQIAPWPIGAVFVPVVHREWTRGLFDVGGAKLVVTSGVGASGVPIRIGVPPEIVLIRLRGA